MRRPSAVVLMAVRGWPPEDFMRRSNSSGCQRGLLDGGLEKASCDHSSKLPSWAAESSHSDFVRGVEMDVTNSVCPKRVRSERVESSDMTRKPVSLPPTARYFPSPLNPTVLSW